MPVSTNTGSIHDGEAGSHDLTREDRLACAAHDLRSPLNAILGWARILSVKHGADPDLAMIAERIERSGRAQLKVIDELEKLARVRED